MTTEPQDPTPEWMLALDGLLPTTPAEPHLQDKRVRITNADRSDFGKQGVICSKAANGSYFIVIDDSIQPNDFERDEFEVIEDPAPRDIPVTLVQPLAELETAQERIRELEGTLKTIYNNAPKVDPTHNPATWGQDAWGFFIAGKYAAAALNIESEKAS